MATDTYFSHFWRLRNPRSRGWQIVYLVRTCFLGQRWKKQKKALWVLFIRSLIPFAEALHFPKALPSSAIVLAISCPRTKTSGL